MDTHRFNGLPIGHMLTILAMTGALAGVWATLAAENAQQKERVDNLKEETKEIKRDVKETRDAVQLILRKLDAAEAQREAAAREARERRK